MSQRLNHILNQLAQSHAPYKTTTWDAVPPRELATHLARHGVMVLVADVAARHISQREGIINDWIAQYGDLYYLLIDALFPSLTEVRAFYADEQYPSIVAIIAESDMITRMLSAYIVPYIAARSQVDYNPLEVRAVVTALLEALSATTIPTARYTSLRDECISRVRYLLQLPLQHTCLTDFAEPLLANWQGSTPPEPTPPPDLPEVAHYQPPQQHDLFSHPLPLFYKRSSSHDQGDRGTNNKRRPPVPPPPKN